MIDLLLKLPRKIKQIIMIFVDCLIIIFTNIISFSVLTGNIYLPEGFLIWLTFVAPPLIAVPVFLTLGMYHSVLRYIGFNAIWTIIKAVSIFAIIWSFISYVYTPGPAQLSIFFINWSLTLLAIGGFRIFSLWVLSFNGNRAKLNIANDAKRVLIYGSGVAGIQLLSALEHSLEYYPLGLIDDSRELQGVNIKGLKVYSFEEVSEIINTFNIDEVLIAIPSASRAVKTAIFDNLEPFSVLVKILPGVSELAEGKVSIEDLREPNIKDLLGRKSVIFDKNLMDRDILNKTILITGAGGSIGSELCRQILLLKPKIVILYEVSEISLYNIELELAKINSHEIKIYPLLGSINNNNLVKQIFNLFSIDTVYHAAAYKHVPIVEYNNAVGIENNIFGTLNCVQAAVSSNVKKFILISTDKAVNPTNTMGASKRCAEQILQSYSAIQNETNLSIVRFGNVLGSSGSVIPLFKNQIKDGGPITVTHPEVIRFFMTIPEAVSLVIQSGSLSSNGDVCVLDMGKPIRIDDLAKRMIRLSGLEIKDKLNPNGDIEIKYVGLRPGEKLYEELLITNNVTKTSNPLIMRAREEFMEWDKLNPILDQLKKSIKEGDSKKARDLLIKIVPEYKPEAKINDLLYNAR